MFRQYNDDVDYLRVIELIEKGLGEKETVKETAHNILKEFVARRIMVEELLKSKKGK